jgi:hypothetical protein
MNYLKRDMSKRKPRLDMVGKNNYFWKGGITVRLGYRYRWNPEHIRADNQGYVREQIIVIEEYLNACLVPWIIVHHIDHNPLNNNLENLYIFNSHKEHGKYHSKEYKLINEIFKNINNPMELHEVVEKLKKLQEELKKNNRFLDQGFKGGLNQSSTVRSTPIPASV